ncbi:hypothetical protein GGI07_000162 [Coemansia sp. Benny D115]|nr:hypothetical protein GGI07_000162 [Coemansia sp. Benny D115]
MQAYSSGMLGASLSCGIRNATSSITTRRVATMIFGTSTAARTSLSRGQGKQAALAPLAAVSRTAFSPFSSSASDGVQLVQQRSGSRIVSSSKLSYGTAPVRRFSTQNQASGWGSYSGTSSRSSIYQSKDASFKDINNSTLRRAAMLRDAAESQMGNPEAQNAYYEELLKPDTRGSRASIVIARIEQGEAAADLTTLQLYLEALMQLKSTPDRAAMRLVELLKAQPHLVKDLTGSESSSGYEKVLHMLADSNGIPSVPQQASQAPSRFAAFESMFSRSKPQPRPQPKHDDDRFYDEEHSDSTGKPHNGGSQGDGTPEQPLHVIVQEKTGSAFWGGIKWLASTIIYAFFILTLVNVTLESSGLMKATNKPGEFEPEPATSDHKFSDVQGCEEAKGELQELVEFLKDPKKFAELGGRLPKGVLLTGPPGTGKTLLARAVAGEAGVPFFFMSGGEFDEIYVGVGASVTGDTPVLVRDDAGTRMTSIGEYIDTYYPGDQEGYAIPVDGVQTLGYDGGSQMEGCDWKKVRQVYRHKVNEIYEIKYMDDMVRTTGDHSVFIRTANGIEAIQARELRVGDVLVDPPHTLKASKRHSSSRHENGTDDSVSAQPIGDLTMWGSAAVGGDVADDMERRRIRAACFSEGVPEDIPVTSQLAQILGLYAAKGYCKDDEMHMVFADCESYAMSVFTKLVKGVFGVAGVSTSVDGNSKQTQLSFSPLVSQFFKRHGGEGLGGCAKHVPEFLWTAPTGLFWAYLDGYLMGCGADQQSRVAVSNEHALLRELAWLASIHRIGATLTDISADKSLDSLDMWRLEVGAQSSKYSTATATTTDSELAHRNVAITSIERVAFDGYVYDFCGCDNEAFFGGNNPVLLHNSKVRKLFAAAREKAPSIVFIDEIDAIGSKRNPRDQVYMKQTLNQLLVDLDGFTQTEGVIFMAATNFPEVLDPALTRPGRFDRVVQVPLPDVRGRAAILKTHAKKIQLAKDVDLTVVARGTPGFSGAELQNLLNIAAIEATKQRSKAVSNKHLDFAKDRIIMGSERKSAVITPEAKLATAYHEGGHTLAAMYTPGAMPLHKVTVMPRGHALGVTVQLPEADRESVNKTEYLAEIDVCMGGRAAEELVFGPEKVTSGCSSDLTRATKVATAMVSQFGMSDNIGLVAYSSEEQDRLSAQGKSAIEREVRALNEASNDRVMKLLTEHREELDRLAKALVEYETLDKNEIERAVKGLPIERDPVSPE